MSKPVLIWEGDAWQGHVVSLLRRRYGTAFQEIPSRDQGDCGLEGFCRTDGTAYQCYAPQEPLETRALYEKHRDKLTTDIGKFIQNKTELQQILQSVVIRRWVLVVPRFESKDLIKHAEKKAAEVMAAALPYAHNPFEIVVCTDDNFEVERAAIHGAALEQLRFQVEAPSAQDVRDWADMNDGLARTLDTKLAKLHRDTIKLRDEFLRRYVEGENLLRSIQAQSPETFERLQATRDGRSKALPVQGLLADAPHHQRLQAVIDEFGGLLASNFKDISPAHYDTLVLASVARWLLYCPLDFVET